MTRRSSSVLLTLVILAAVGWAAAAMIDASRARAAAVRGLVKFERLRTQVVELTSLRSASPSAGKASDSRGPKLATLAAEVVSAAGLPAAALSSLSQESETIDRSAAGVPIARRRATLTLTPLTLPQFGRVLELWRQRASVWTIARIDLEPRRDAAAAPGSDLAIRAVVVVESVSLAADRRNP